MDRSRALPLLTAVLLAACTTATPTATPAAAPAHSPTGAPATPPATAEATSTPAGPSSPAPSPSPSPIPVGELAVETFGVPAGSGPHDVAPAVDGGVWYTAQASGELGWLDPGTGDVRSVPLGEQSRPHGVIVGPDDAAWVTDGGLNAIVRVDPETLALRVFELPIEVNANLNTAAFDGDEALWFTGQQGFHGRLDPTSGEIAVFDSPRGQGPYGITATPSGDVYLASLAGSYLGRIDTESGAVEVLEPPTVAAGVRRAWSDSQGRIWVAEWNVGQVGRYDPATGEWREWRLPGAAPMAYAVFVDERDIVWLTDFGGNALVRFDPETEEFMPLALPGPRAEVRQLLGRPGELWGAASALDQLVLVRTGG